MKNVRKENIIVISGIIALCTVLSFWCMHAAHPADIIAERFVWLFGIVIGLYLSALAMQVSSK